MRSFESRSPLGHKLLLAGRKFAMQRQEKFKKAGGQVSRRIEIGRSGVHGEGWRRRRGRLLQQPEGSIGRGRTAINCRVQVVTRLQHRFAHPVGQIKGNSPAKRFKVGRAAYLATSM